MTSRRILTTKMTKDYHYAYGPEAFAPGPFLVRYFLHPRVALTYHFSLSAKELKGHQHHTKMVVPKGVLEHFVPNLREMK